MSLSRPPLGASSASRLEEPFGIHFNWLCFVVRERDCNLPARVCLCVCLCFFICLYMGVYTCLICVFVIVFLFVCLYLFMFTSLCVCAWACMFDHISKHCEKGRRRRRSITESIPVLLLKCSFIDFPPSPTHSPNPNPTQPHPSPPNPTQSLSEKVTYSLHRGCYDVIDLGAGTGMDDK